MIQLRAPKGMNDLFEDELVTWRTVEAAARTVCLNYGYGEIRTPILEDIGVFVRGIGDATDVVEKEMYVLEDRDGKSLCLRPENTSSVVRALIENGRLVPETETRVFYLGNMFRRERPQKGRLRQFSQLGAEVFGVDSPEVDLEIIGLIFDFFRSIGIDGLKLTLNSLGQQADRQGFQQELVHYFSSHKEALCADCQRRLEKNPLRILDCKNPTCGMLFEKAPRILDHLGERSKQHFAAVCSGLERMAIPYTVNPRLVRGLDYYTDTVFEVLADSGLGSQNTVAAGGRYDGLVETLGGAPTPGVGFSIGIERVLLILAERGQTQTKAKPDLALVYPDEAGKAGALDLLWKLRSQRIFVSCDLKGRSMKSQMRRADKENARCVLVLGEREIQQNHAQLKILGTGELVEVELNDTSIVRALEKLRKP